MSADKHIDPDIPRHDRHLGGSRRFRLPLQGSSIGGARVGFSEEHGLACWNPARNWSIFSKLDMVVAGTGTRY